jgi:hypothetical protein
MRGMLRLGSLYEPVWDWVWLALQLVCMGIPATFVLTRAGLDSWRPERLARAERAFRSAPWLKCVWLLAFVGAAVPYLLRVALLQHAPLTDDESAYLFSARLLASGRLYVPSPRMPVFFDNGFVVNDGRMYGQYFLGWPALLALGVRLSAAELVNPLLHGITVFSIASVAASRWGKAWGLVAGLLVLASPFLMVGAATQMSHTSCLCALALLLLGVQAAERDDAPLTVSAAVAVCFCAAFWIRPATALGIGLPLLWGFARARARAPRRFAHFALASALALTGAALFLLANRALTGSPWITGYHAKFQSAVDTAFRFVSVGPAAGHAEKFLFFFIDRSPADIVGHYVIAWARIWVDAHGWPIGLSLILLADRASWRWLLGSTLGLFLVQFAVLDAGIDSFGPVHYTELMLPLLLLQTAGLRTLWHWGKRHGLPGLAPSLVAANLICSLLYFVPVRLGSLAALVRDIRAPSEAMARAPSNSIVFYRPPFAPACYAKDSHNWVSFRPDNTPDLTDERLWANHISLTHDRALVAAMRRSHGYVLRQAKTCQWTLVPLEAATEAEFPQSVALLPGDLGERPRKHP